MANRVDALSLRPTSIDAEVPSDPHGRGIAARLVWRNCSGASKARRVLMQISNDMPFAIAKEYSMNATTTVSSRWFAFLLRAIDHGLTSLGQVWLDAVRVRYGRPGYEWDHGHEDADEELRLMVALSCAGFH